MVSQSARLSLEGKFLTRLPELARAIKPSLFKQLNALRDCPNEDSLVSSVCVLSRPPRRHKFEDQETH